MVALEEDDLRALALLVGGFGEVLDLVRFEEVVVGASATKPSSEAYSSAVRFGILECCLLIFDFMIRGLGAEVLRIDELRSINRQEKCIASRRT